MGFFVVSASGLPVLVFALTSECHTWELDAVFSFTPLATGLPRYGLNLNSVLWASPVCEIRTQCDWRSAVFDTKPIMSFDFATTRSSPFLRLGVGVYFGLYQILEIESGNTIHPQTSIQRNNFRLSWILNDWSLFLTHPTYKNEWLCLHSCEECKRSNEPRDCHRLWSILWQLVHRYFKTIWEQTFDYSPTVPVLPFWSDGRLCMK